ncbi:MAG TPA: hypothetical protein VH988_11515 [Thermoanaerobaculia bacterium]|jgi:hypothetical protein|nr:hypothetical protein [Thermoanaerobaculia bacterium]
MKSNWKSFVVLTALLATTTTGCRVRQTQEGKAPEVEVKGGQVPKYDVQTGSVDVKTKEKTIKVPEVDVHMPPKDAPANSDKTPPPPQ